MKKRILAIAAILLSGCSSASYNITLPKDVTAVKGADGMPYAVFIYINTTMDRKGLDSLLRADGGQANVAQGKIDATNTPTINNPTDK